MHPLGIQCVCVLAFVNYFSSNECSPLNIIATIPSTDVIHLKKRKILSLLLLNFWFTTLTHPYVANCVHDQNFVNYLQRKKKLFPLFLNEGISLTAHYNFTKKKWGKILREEDENIKTISDVFKIFSFMVYEAYYRLLSNALFHLLV